MDYTVADYQSEAKRIIEELNNKDTIPILVGGNIILSGVADDYTFYPMKPNMKIRKKRGNR